MVFMSLCPWIPGKTGLAKGAFLDIIIGVVLIGTELLHSGKGNPVRVHLIMALVMIPLYGLDLGGLSSVMPAYLEPILGKLGIGTIGNIALAGSVSNELLNGYRELSYNRALCKGCRSCEEVCPQGVWDMEGSKCAVMANKKACTACRACVVQCKSGAIQVPRVEKMTA
jgi:NAD-dependent dihydropyrimidine dehydrogenase PreA subunit